MPQHTKSKAETKTKSRFRRATVTAVTVASLVVAPAAWGAGTSPSDAQYNSTLTQISAGGPHEGGPNGPSGTATSGGSLPFTGFDIGAMAAVAAGLGLAGFTMRRRLQTSDDDRLS
jgi:hypothetical protein